MIGKVNGNDSSLTLWLILQLYAPACTLMQFNGLKLCKTIPKPIGHVSIFPVLCNGSQVMQTQSQHWQENTEVLHWSFDEKFVYYMTYLPALS